MAPEPALQLVWFKRDLRVADHAALARAAAGGPVLPLYVIEPELLRAPDHDALHYDFVRQSLAELRGRLARLGQPLVVRTGDPAEVFAQINRHLPIGRLWSHQETGNALTYARDRRVARWAREAAVPWSQPPQGGVVRALGSRDGWSREWERRMARPLVPAPGRLEPVCGIAPGDLPTAAELGLAHGTGAGVARDCDVAGGETEALCWLDSFLGGRGRRYHREMSSPVTAYESCSRLSAYLAHGCVSLRTVTQRARRRLDELADGPGDAAREARRGLEAFIERLHWRCHFMQKLESEPAIEERCFNPAYEGLREQPSDELYGAWCAGRTGYPFVDACMRALQTRGWINFRMRAMLVSFAAYDLWLDWRVIRDFLARQFVDYEPGIHYSQLQMQSGTTGINALRVYNPVKQGLDHDPGGDFVRRWVPELDAIRDERIHVPWRVPREEQVRLGTVVGTHYPKPVVDHGRAAARAKERIARVRGSAPARAESRRVVREHGSRRRSRRGSGRR